MRLARRAGELLGRRGAALAFLAFVDAVFALSLATAPAEVADSGTYAYLASAAPLWVWAVPWAVVAVLCALYSVRERDRPAYVAAVALKVGWGSIYLTGWACGEIPRGYVPAAVWLAFAAFVYLLAGWPDHVRKPPWAPKS